MSLRKLILALVLILPTLLACAGPATAEEFEEAAIRLERNVTDDDAEAVLFVKTEESGLASLLVVAPDGRRVANLASRNRRNLGAREVLLESPEPAPAPVLAAFPAGTYHFIGRTFDGDEIRAEAELSHDFPDAAILTFPADGASVPAAGLVIEWEPVPGVSGYFLEVEEEESETALEVELPASATHFSPSADWLVPGSVYVIGIGTIGENGNRTFVETTFTVTE